MSGQMKINRIKSRHKAELTLLGDVVKTAQEAVPKLKMEATNRVEFREMEQAMSALGKYTRADGFDPTRKFQHVASFSTPIWTLILDMFAKYDEQTGELMDDGLLYKMDEATQCLKFNKPFFYALIDYFEAQGIPCDMRGKIKLT